MIHKSCFYFISKFDKSLINKLEKNIHIIYRNYLKKYEKSEILQIKKLCKSQGRKFFLANNLKLAKNLRLDGAYIPSFNKSPIPSVFNKNNFIILGSAHNLNEIIQKKKQNVDLLFISPLFKIRKKKYFLGPIKYNILSKQFNKKTIALGGINKQNLRMIDKINCYGFASISYIEKHKLNGKR
tara:strand:+ start:194 stop:742 length:549 start_codon:yes stop_codon:yes gene_type:complete